MVKNLNSTKGRLDLLTIYYGAKNFSRLQKVKSGVDPDYIFKFGMSIPPE
ncbi:MAG: BBE domain-containing protein [Flavobacteriales bacterium]|nr:BBE domain-containing protein [Flavobacteriales bacterium]